nr:MFS transporter [Ardenticatenaceae bacterium]
MIYPGQHPTPNTQHPTPNTQHPTPNTQHPTPNTQHPTPNTQHPTPSMISSFRPLILPLFLPSLFGALLLGIVQPVLPLYLQSGGASLAVIGTVISARPLGALIFGLPGSGILSRYSMRKTTMGGLVVVVFSLLGMSRVTAFWGLFALWLLAGMGLSLFEIGRHQFIAHWIDNRFRGRAVSVLGGSARLGSTIGPAVGGLAAEAYGFDVPFLIMAGLALCSLVVVYFFLPELTEPGGGREFSLTGYLGELRETAWIYRRLLVAAGSAQLIMQMVRQGRQVFIPLFASGILGLNVANVGLVMSIGSGFDTAFFWTSGIIMDRFGRKAAIIPGLFVQLLGFLIMPFTFSFWSLAAVSAFLGFGNGITSGTMLTLGADLAPEQRRVSFLGIWRLSSSLGFTLGPNAVGLVAQWFTLSPASWVISAFAGTGIFLFWRFVPETLEQKLEDHPKKIKK